MERRTGKPCVGVVPYISNLDLAEEDSVGLESRDHQRTTGDLWEACSLPPRKLRIAVIAFPYLSNFTDFDALSAEPYVSLRFVDTPADLPHADVMILPGTKQTVDDFGWLRESGIADIIARHAQSAVVIGICGGMQMMGMSISDPHHMEGGGQATGLGLLPIRTVLKPDKVTVPVTANLTSSTLLGLVCGAGSATGYEIHLGETTYEHGAKPLFRLRRSNEAMETVDGAQNSTGLCFGTYVHGLFDSDEFRHSFLANARAVCGLEPARNVVFRASSRDAALNRLADAVEKAVDLKQVCAWLEMPPKRAEMAHEHSR